MFNIDHDRYRVIDISSLVVPGSDPGRPFEMTKGRLGDGTFKYDICNTNTHVGTHVESAAHFFEDGAAIDEYEIASFYGRGILLDIDLPDSERHITLDYVKGRIDDIIKEHDIVVCRIIQGSWDAKKYLAEDVALYFRDKNAKMVVLGDGVSMGETIDQGRRFHEILMRNTTLLELVNGLDQISKREFFVMALPMLVKGLDSSWCRAIVIEEK